LKTALETLNKLQLTPNPTPASLLKETDFRFSLKETATRLDGNQFALDPAYVSFLRDVNLELSKREDYVAVGPYGSQFTGYALPDSNFDVILLAGDASLKVEHEFAELVAGIGNKYGKQARVVHSWSSDFCPANFNSRHFRAEYGHALWPLTYPLIGRHEKISEFRKLVTSRHHMMLESSPRFAHDTVANGVHELLFWEMHVHAGFTSDQVTSIMPSNDSDRQKTRPDVV